MGMRAPPVSQFYNNVSQRLSFVKQAHTKNGLAADPHGRKISAGNSLVVFCEGTRGVLQAVDGAGGMKRTNASQNDNRLMIAQSMASFLAKD
jgi:hypothetical protein